MPTSNPPSGRIIVLRMIWAVLLLGQLTFAGVITMYLWEQPGFVPNQAAAQKLTIISAIMMVVLLPLAFVIRQIIYHAAPDGQIDPGKFATGNIVFYAVCEAVSFTGMIAMLFHGGPGGVIIVPAIAVALQIVNYPQPKSMT